MENNLKKHIQIGLLGNVVIKLSGTFLSLILAVILARSLGPSEYGSYTYIYALISFFAMPVQLGLPTLVLRETSKEFVNKQWSTLIGLWYWALSVGGLFSIGVAILTLGFAWLFNDHFTLSNLETFTFAIMLIPLLVLSGIIEGALNGLHRVILGRLTNTVLRPGLFILLLLIALTSLPENTLVPANAMALHVFSAFISLLVGISFLIRCTPSPMKKAISPPNYESKKWLSNALPFALMGGIQLINQYTDILMLGFFETNEKVGLYRVASQGAVLVVFGRQVILSVVTPYLARFYAQDNLIRLQRLTIFSVRSTVAFALPVFIILFIWGNNILGVIFGKEYAAAHTTLIILASGQIINTFFGPAGQLLNMAGYERDAARGIIIAACANISLNLILIPLLGIMGAATATAFTLVLWNTILWRKVNHRLSINCSIFGSSPGNKGITCPRGHKESNHISVDKQND